MNRTTFQALVQAERSRHPCSWSVPLSKAKRDLIESVWQWAESRGATIQEVQAELRVTMEDPLPESANSKGGGFLRVIRDYDG